MHIRHDLGNVRIVWAGDAMTNAYDIRVEWLVDGEWQLYSGHNSLSCDYAHYNAREDAIAAVKRLAAEAAGAMS